MKENQRNNFLLSRRGEQDHELPQHILEEIIVRLLAKSIVRFKGVCRQWFNIISDLDLPDVKFQQSISKLRIVYLIMNSRNRSTYDLLSYYSFKVDEEGTKAKKVATSRLQNVSYYYYPVKLACNSLLLFLGNGSKLYVYDTITEQQKLLPEIPELRGLKGGDSFYTIVYDASKGNYKVVAPVFFYDHEIQGMKLFLYDLHPREWWTKEKWRQSEPPFPQIIKEHSSIVVQGVLYWIAVPNDENNCVIQPMEIATEKIMERIEAPCQPTGISATYELLEIKGSLCLVNAVSGDELNIWVLKDSVQSFWIKQYNIALSSLVNGPPILDHGFLHPLSFQPRLIVENQILVIIRQALYWYNMDTKELSEITVEADPLCCRCTFSIIKY